jgi:hypothetical protein
MAFVPVWTFAQNSPSGLFSHTRENPIKIWGWSRDGKVGISELKFNDNRGGIIITAFVFNAVSDTALWERNIDHYDDDGGYSGIPENELNVFFSNFQNVCRQQFGIEIQETRLMVPSGSAIRHNGNTYDIAINSIRVEEDMVRSYSVTAEIGGKRKTILSKDTFLPELPRFSWYSISPFEKRALIIVRWNGLSHSYGFIYAGCHLAAGFR